VALIPRKYYQYWQFIPTVNGGVANESLANAGYYQSAAQCENGVSWGEAKGYIALAEVRECRWQGQ
jgi:hypothetical protein